MTEEYTITEERMANVFTVRIDGDFIVVDMAIGNEHVRYPLDPYSAQYMAKTLNKLAERLTIRLLTKRRDRK